MRWRATGLVVVGMFLNLGCVGDNSASSDERLRSRLEVIDEQLEQGTGGRPQGLEGIHRRRWQAQGRQVALWQCWSRRGRWVSGMPADPPPTHLVERPATYFLPRGYDAAEPMALVISLHGYTLNASHQNAYFTLSENS